MGKNNKAGSLKLPDQVQSIFDEYADQKRFSDDVIFPELKMIEDFDDQYLVQGRSAMVSKQPINGLRNWQLSLK